MGILVDELESEAEHARVFRRVYRFLDMAMQAYKDTSMAEAFPRFVKKSHLIKDVKNPSRLLNCLIPTDTEVHVCILQEGSVAFVFRGTEPSKWGFGFDLADVITDLAHQLKPVEFYHASDIPCYSALPSIQAHRGFQLALRDVTKTSNPEENLHMVAEALAGDKGRHIERVFCVGHSLGGALATLCASWCRYVAFPSAEINCITFGSPRVGNRAFAVDFNENVAPRDHSYRLVNKTDKVPTLPPSWWSPLYEHVGGLVHVKEDFTERDMIVAKRGGMQLQHHCCNAYVVSVCNALLKYKDVKRKVEDVKQKVEDAKLHVEQKIEDVMQKVGRSFISEKLEEQSCGFTTTANTCNTGPKM